jgi:hypothetical protein
MSFRDRLRAVKEALVKPYGTAWVGGFRSLWGASEPPKINREAYVELYEEDPIAKGAIDQNVADALGGGFFTSVAEDEEAKAHANKVFNEALAQAQKAYREAMAQAEKEAEGP